MSVAVEDWAAINRSAVLAMMVIKTAQRDLDSSDPRLRESAIAFLSGEGEPGLLEAWCDEAEVNPEDVIRLTARYLEKQQRGITGGTKAIGGDEVPAWGLSPDELEERFADLREEWEEGGEEAEAAGEGAFTTNDDHGDRCECDECEE